MTFGLLKRVVLVLAALFPGAAVAQELFTPMISAKLGAELDRLLKSRNVPSVAVGVSVPGKGTYRYASGMADLQTGGVRTIEQPFRIASLTKTFVATAVLQLVDQGRLAKGDMLARWFPSFPNADRITVDDLLRMRSGIAAPSDEAIIEKIFDDPAMPAPSLAEMMDESAGMVAQFKAPGSVGVYTNLNYFILAGIVERVSESGIGAFIEANIIGPLHLSQTSYPTSDELAGGLHGYGWNAALHRFDDKTLFNPALGGAAGAMTSGITDLEVYVRALCTGTLLKPETQRSRMEGQVLDGTGVGYGEGVISSGGFCGHSGTVPGFNTDMYYIERLGASLIVSVNRLDRDDVAQTGPFRAAVYDALKAQFGAEAR